MRRSRSYSSVSRSRRVTFPRVARRRSIRWWRCASSKLLSRVHVPADVDERVAAANKHLRCTSARRVSFSVDFDFVNVRRVDEHGVAVNLYLRFWELEFYELAAAFNKRLRLREHRGAIRPTLTAVADRNHLFRNQLFQRRAIVCEPRPPHGFTRGEYSLPNLRRNDHRFSHLRCTPFGIDDRVRRDLDPASLALRVNVHDAKTAQRHVVAPTLTEK